MKLDLLLASADDARPVLDDGLDVASTAGMSPPEAVRQPDARLRYDAADPDALPQQRWGVVAPEGQAGGRLLAALKPLLAARRLAQGDREIFIAQVPPDMNARAARSWKEAVYDRLPVPDQPRYLLFLGDLDQVSLDLQQAFAHDTFSGRLAFRREPEYEAYAAKVLDHEGRPPLAPPRVLLFSVDDGTRATSLGHDRLIEPIAAECRAQREMAVGRFADAVIGEVLRGGHEKDELLACAARRDPTVLFSLSHGLPARRGSSDEARRAEQGSLSLGDGERLTAADVTGRPFLPGGVWFLFACYGVATPERSVFHHWLRELEAHVDLERPARRVLDNLPQPSERPFVAALPQAALANPDGPLAVIGHADLAWTYAFLDPGPGGRRHASRFQTIVRGLVDGRRTGVATHEIPRFFLDTCVELTEMYDAEARGDAAATDEEREVRKAHLWMRRNDLGGYLLLGDPAVALTGARPAVAAPVVVPAARGLDAARMEEAVLAALSGGDAHEAAVRHGVTAVEVTRWVEAYRQVGKAVLEAIRRERG